MTNQIWCERGHYTLDDSDMLWTGSITEVGCSCLIKGCGAKIIIRHSFYDKHERGFIIPRPTDVPDTFRQSILLEDAQKLRVKAEALEKEAANVKLFAIPDIATEQTVIDPEKYIHWFVHGGEAPRVPLSDVLIKKSKE